MGSRLAAGGGGEEEEKFESNPRVFPSSQSAARCWDVVMVVPVHTLVEECSAVFRTSVVV